MIYRQFKCECSNITLTPLVNIKVIERVTTYECPACKKRYTLFENLNIIVREVNLVELIKCQFI